MTDIPAPPLSPPPVLRRPSRFRRFIDNPLVPIAIAVASLLYSGQVQLQQAQNTEDIAQTSASVSATAKAQSDLNEQLNSRLQAAFCDLLVSVGNPSAMPTTIVGVENVGKYRKAAAVLSCPSQIYLISSDAVNERLQQLTAITNTKIP